jgi:hypothetical protein
MLIFALLLVQRTQDTTERSKETPLVIPKRAMPGLADIPADCVIYVLSFLSDPKTVGRLGCTCWWFNEICGRDEVWQPLVKRCVSPSRLNELRAVLRGSLATLVTSWKAIFQLEKMHSTSVNLSEALSVMVLDVPQLRDLHTKFYRPSSVASAADRKTAVRDLSRLIRHSAAQISVQFRQWEESSKKVVAMPVINLGRHGCIGQDGARQLSLMLLSHTTISVETMLLDHQLIRTDGLRDLTVPIIDVCFRLSRLSFRDCRLDLHAGANIKLIIAMCKQLTSLDLSENKLDEAVCLAIAEGLTIRQADSRSGFEALALDGNPLGDKGSAMVLKAFLDVNRPAVPIHQSRTLSLRAVGLRDAEGLSSFVREWCLLFPRISAETQKRRPWNAREIGDDGVEVVKPTSYFSLLLNLGDGDLLRPARPMEGSGAKINANKLKPALVAALMAENAKAGEPICAELPSAATEGTGKGKGCSIC